MSCDAKHRPTPPAHRPLPLPCADGSYRASLLRPERDRRFSRLALSLVGQRDGVAGSFGQGQGDELVGAACGLALDLCDHVPRLESRGARGRSEEHTSELQSLRHLVCRLLLEKKNNKRNSRTIPT